MPWPAALYYPRCATILLVASSLPWRASDCAASKAHVLHTTAAARSILTPTDYASHGPCDPVGWCGRLRSAQATNRRLLRMRRASSLAQLSSARALVRINRVSPDCWLWIWQLLKGGCIAWRSLTMKSRPHDYYPYNMQMCTRLLL